MLVKRLENSTRRSRKSPFTSGLLVGLILLASLTASNSLSFAKGKAKGQDDPQCRQCMIEAASLFAAGNNNEAAHKLAQFSNRCPQNAQLHLLYSTILARFGNRNDEAEAAARKAIEAQDDLTAAHLQLGLLLATNHKPVEAVQEMEKVVELDPTNYEAWSMLGELYARMQEPQKSMLAQSKASALEPGNKDSRLRVVRNLVKANKIDAAKRELKSLINENSPELSIDLAREALDIGAGDEALLAAQKCVKQYPDNLTPLKLLAHAQYATNDLSGCLETSNNILKLNANNQEAEAMIGLAYLSLNQREEAEKQFKRALDHNSSNSLALFGMGRLALQRGNNQEAQNLLRQCLDLGLKGIEAIYAQEDLDKIDQSSESLLNDKAN